MDWNKIKKEIRFRTSRSSGSGGQHVNKTETRVEAILDVADSAGLSDDEKIQLFDRLSNRINEEGQLVIVSEQSRSQFTNKEDAINRMRVVLEKGVRIPIKRVKTRPTAESKEKRLKAKKEKSEVKKSRRKPKP